MSQIVRHPAFARVQHTVPDEDVARWEASGWLPLLDDAQRARLAQIEAEVEQRCPTCEASGDEPCHTASGRKTDAHAARN